MVDCLPILGMRNIYNASKRGCSYLGLFVRNGTADYKHVGWLLLLLMNSSTLFVNESLDELIHKISFFTNLTQAQINLTMKYSNENLLLDIEARMQHCSHRSLCTMDEYIG